VGRLFQLRTAEVKKGRLAYALSKAAVSKFHKNLVAELEGIGVLSCIVNPGAVATELGKPADAINKMAMEHPTMQAFLGLARAPRKTHSVECCAAIVVAVAADERCKALHGRRLNADQDLEPVLVEAEKVDQGRIGRETLYMVNIGEVYLVSRNELVSFFLRTRNHLIGIAIR
jgi:NAD(P)-dependent dehydrogenase (short-subunit alcohol dehydrogenase family)